MATRLKALLGRGTPTAPLSEQASLRRALVRRQKLVDRLFAFAPHLRTLLLVAGLAYTLALPYKGLGRKHYISENALQPGHVRRVSPSSARPPPRTRADRRRRAHSGQHVLELGRCARRRRVRRQGGAVESRGHVGRAVRPFLLSRFTKRSLTRCPSGEVAASKRPLTSSASRLRSRGTLSSWRTTRLVPAPSLARVLVADLSRGSRPSPESTPTRSSPHPKPTEQRLSSSLLRG